MFVSYESIPTDLPELKLDPRWEFRYRKKKDKLSYSISQLQTCWNLRLLLVRDDPKLPDDSGKGSKPNVVVGCSISGREIDKFTMCRVYVNSSILKVKNATFHFYDFHIFISR